LGQKKSAWVRTVSDRVRIIKHEAVSPVWQLRGPTPGRAWERLFLLDDLPSRRLRPETLDRDTALEKAKAVARAAKE